MKLPKRKNIFKSGETDPADYYYNFFTGSFYRKRLEIALQLLGNERFEKILDIGYGCGLLFPELHRRGKKLYGVDVHTNADKIKQLMKKENIEAELFSGSVLNLPFSDAFFDCVICVSVLEHIKDLATAVKEIHRVTEDGGCAIFGFPVENNFTNFLFEILRFDYKKEHVSSHKMILKALKEQFDVVEFKKIPTLLPLDNSLYLAVKCVKTMSQ